MSQPLYYPAQQPQQPTPKSRPLLVFAVIAAVLISAFVTTVVVMATPEKVSGTAGPGSGSAKPISRAELMSKYAKIAPLDRSATPDAVDKLAGLACDRLNAGTSTDDLISLLTEQYRANATEVLHLLVSYRCPKFLKDFT